MHRLLLSLGIVWTVCALTAVVAAIGGWMLTAPPLWDWLYWELRGLGDIAGIVVAVVTIAPGVVLVWVSRW